METPVPLMSATWLEDARTLQLFVMTQTPALVVGAITITDACMMTNLRGFVMMLMLAPLICVIRSAGAAILMSLIVLVTH
jgi:hypothetical protein